MDIIKKRFGEQLKYLRKIKNYTQESLSEAIGINLRQLARVEAGESFVSSDTLYKICKTLEISPQVLFNFDLEEELLMTGTDNRLYFNVTKNGKILTLVLKNDNKTDEVNEQSFDTRMLSIAQRLQKEIFVNEIEDGVEICTKLYSPNGEIKTINNSENKYELLKNNINSIAKDKKKLEYMNLAYESLFDKEALKELKTLIKGIELTQE